MPFDLVRHDLLMDLKPLKPLRIRLIIDEIFKEQQTRFSSVSDHYERTVAIIDESRKAA